MALLDKKIELSEIQRLLVQRLVNGQAEISEVVDIVLEQGTRHKASDIHFESYKDVVRIRYRIDGFFRDVLTLPAEHHDRLIARLKVMAELNAHEKTKPQDGRISLFVANKRIDFRISTVPTVSGEKAVVRVFDAARFVFDMDKLGLYPETQKKLVVKNEKLYEDAKDNEKKVRSEIGQSWTGVQDHNAALVKVDNAKETWINSKDDLMSLYRERSDVLKKVRVLEDLIEQLDSIPSVKTNTTGIIGITLDNTCRTFIKNNFESNCPTFEFLNTLYPGTQCDYIDHSCLDYFRQIGGFHYIIDPKASIMDRIKMVEIRYSFDEFHLQDERGYDNENHTINYQVGRYMDSCKTAYIGTDSWLKYAGDSIYLLWKGCDPKYTYLDNQFRSESLNQTVHDITTSKKWQLDEWIKETREKCREICFEY